MPENTSCQHTVQPHHTSGCEAVGNVLQTHCKRRSRRWRADRRACGWQNTVRGTASDLPASPVETPSVGDRCDRGRPVATVESPLHLPLVRPNPAIPFLRDLAKGMAPAEALITTGPCCSSLLARQVVVIGVEAEAYEASAGQIQPGSCGVIRSASEEGRLSRLIQLIVGYHQRGDIRHNAFLDMQRYFKR